MFDAEATQLRHALRSADRSGVGRGYPKTLRARVVAYARWDVVAGWPRTDVADALGLSLAMLARGRSRRPQNTRLPQDFARTGVR